MIKTGIKLTLAAFAVLLCTAAVLSVGRPVPAYNPEQVKGNIRVVLLRVDQTTVFTDVGFSESVQGKIHAVPGVSVTYLVEMLGDEPVKHRNNVSDGKLITVNGNATEDRLPDNLVAGGHGATYEYSHYDWKMLKKPTVTNAKRSHIEEDWRRGVKVSAGTIDLNIKAGFNDRIEEFVFKNVPVE